MSDINKKIKRSSNIKHAFIWPKITTALARKYQIAYPFALILSIDFFINCVYF